MLAVIITILTITATSLCSANSYCDNNDNNRVVYIQCKQLNAVLAVIVTLLTMTGPLYVVLTVIVTITGRSMCSVSSYCDNNGEVYM